MAHNAPHMPIEAKPELVKHNEKKITPKHRHRNPAYDAMVHCLDESVGRLLERLEKNGLAKRIVVNFASDNGGLPAAWRSDRGTVVRRRSLTGKGPARGASLFHRHALTFLVDDYTDFTRTP